MNIYFLILCQHFQFVGTHFYHCRRLFRIRPINTKQLYQRKTSLFSASPGPTALYRTSRSTGGGNLFQSTFRHTVTHSYRDNGVFSFNDELTFFTVFDVQLFKLILHNI